MKPSVKVNQRKFNFIYQRLLAGFMTVSVVVVASLTLVKNLKVSFLSIYNAEDTLYISLDLMTNDDISSVIVEVSSVYEVHEQVVGLGQQLLIFENLVLGRNYQVKVKADLGFGLQTIKETEYQLTKEAQGVFTYAYQSGQMIYYDYEIFDYYNKIDGHIRIKVFEDGKLIQEGPIDQTLIDGYLSWYGYIENINPKGIIYQIRIEVSIKGRYQLLDEIEVKTTDLPMIQGEFYLDLDNLNYFIYVEDMFEVMTSNKLTIKIYDGGDLIETVIHDLSTGYQISNTLIGYSKDTYRIKIYASINHKETLIGDRIMTRYIEGGI